MTNRSVINILAERDALRDHTHGLFTPGVSFWRRDFLDESCWDEYSGAYTRKHAALSASAVNLDQLRSAGLL